MIPKVSVIVPVYNAELSIAKCLDSLVNQTLDAIEIIVINDGSNDNSAMIVNNYIVKYPDKIKLFSKENAGIARARNYGLEKITGEYFGFLDSDDYAELTMFEVMYKAAKELNADLVVSNFIWEYPKQKKIGVEGPYNIQQEMMVNLFATLWNKLYRTDLIKSLKISFPDGYRYEDAYFLYCLTPSINRIAFINATYVHYVQRSGSITHTHNDRVKDMIDVFNKILMYYKQNDYFDSYYDELEYIFIKFFLGNSFLRTCQIDDDKDRKHTLELSWNILNSNFPNWKNNRYITNKRSLKNRFYHFVTVNNYYKFSLIFRIKTKIDKFIRGA